MNSLGKILVVDDDETLTKLLRQKLTDNGYEIMTAADGREALEVYREFHPDIIILDILMPVMDGYTFVQEFKKIGNIKVTPIIILTSRPDLQDIFALEGINDYIVKPFKMEDLLRKIDKRMKSKVKKILVVDDEPEVINVIENRLRTNGYEVITASDGLNGLLLAKRELPDLMLLDVMMPKLDGYNVCRLLKYDDNYKDIVIIMLSALSREHDSRVGQEVGADAYLTKPYDPSNLLNKIKEFLWD